MSPSEKVHRAPGSADSEFLRLGRWKRWEGLAFLTPQILARKDVGHVGLWLKSPKSCGEAAAWDGPGRRPLRKVPTLRAALASLSQQPQRGPCSPQSRGAP